jgi:hypothetical protein
MGNRQWAMGNKQWAIGNRQWAIGNGGFAIKYKNLKAALNSGFFIGN